MSFNNTVDYIPNQPFSHLSNDSSAQDLKKLQSQKWRVLFGTFLLVAVVANIWNWTRQPVFESQAILHFAYPSKTELEFSQLAERKVATHKQRFMSNSVLQATFAELTYKEGDPLEIENNEGLLSADASGRLITLTAKYYEPEVLEPTLSAWISTYLKLVESEKLENNSEALTESNTQLQAIELKIEQKRQELRLFGEQNDITSLERDENRVLNKIKALSANLDTAIAEQTTAQALLNSLNESVKKSQSIIRDVDQGQISQTRQELQLLKSELSALEEKYTQTYLARDPTVVKKQQTLKVLEKSLAEQLAVSQEYYLQDAARDLTAAKDKAKQTQVQFVEQNKKAQIFNQKLQAYKVLSDDLAAIQEQAQTIRNQQVKQEVSQPFDAKISILESPFTPNFPSGPDYWLMTLISLLIATGSSVFALLLFGYIVKQKQPVQPATNVVVMPGQTMGNTFGHLPHEQNAQLNMQESQMRLAENSQSPTRLLSEEEVHNLFKIANSQGKVLIGLVLSGVTAAELIGLSQVSFSEDYSCVGISGSSARTLKLSPPLTSELIQFCKDKYASESIWSHIETENDFIQIVVNAGHDAELDHSEQLHLSVLRHTYITYLVHQGARLNDIEKITGYIVPSDLAQYRQVKRKAPSQDLADIDIHYPLID